MSEVAIFIIGAMAGFSLAALLLLKACRDVMKMQHFCIARLVAIDKEAREMTDRLCREYENHPKAN